MSTKFDLIKHLDTPSCQPTELDNIKYQQIDVQVEGTQYTIKVPLRECEQVQRFIENNKNITYQQFKYLIRQHRAIRS